MDSFLLVAIALILMAVAVYSLALGGAESDAKRKDDWLVARHTIPGPPKACPDCRHLIRQCCDSITGDDHMQACQWREGLPRYWVDTPAGRYWQEFHYLDDRAAEAMNAVTAAELWSDREDAA